MAIISAIGSQCLLNVAANDDRMAVMFHAFSSHPILKRFSVTKRHASTIHRGHWLWEKAILNLHLFYNSYRIVIFLLKWCWKRERKKRILKLIYCHLSCVIIYKTNYLVNLLNKHHMKWLIKYDTLCTPTSYASETSWNFFAELGSFLLTSGWYFLASCW